MTTNHQKTGMDPIPKVSCIWNIYIRQWTTPNIILVQLNHCYKYLENHSYEHHVITGHPTSVHLMFCHRQCQHSISAHFWDENYISVTWCRFLKFCVVTNNKNYATFTMIIILYNIKHDNSVKLLSLQAVYLM